MPRVDIFVGLAGHLNLKLLPSPQPPNVMRRLVARRTGLLEAVDLGHDEFGFGWFGVGDVDRVAGAGGDAVEFAGE